MIACDNPNCPIEWFHYECVGLLEPPVGQWFCPPCSVKMGRPSSIPQAVIPAAIIPEKPQINVVAAAAEQDTQHGHNDNDKKLEAKTATPNIPAHHPRRDGEQANNADANINGADDVGDDEELDGNEDEKEQQSHSARTSSGSGTASNSHASTPAPATDMLDIDTLPLTKNNKLLKLGKTKAQSLHPIVPIVSSPPKRRRTTQMKESLSIPDIAPAAVPSTAEFTTPTSSNPVKRPRGRPRKSVGV